MKTTISKYLLENNVYKDRYMVHMRMVYYDQIMDALKEQEKEIERLKLELKKQEPREITKEEWESWKKEKHRDPLCMYWRGDITPFWILKPEDVHEPAYLIGDIKIFKGKPDKEKMYKMWLK